MVFDHSCRGEDVIRSRVVRDADVPAAERFKDFEVTVPIG